jgi:cell division protein FtsQ
MAKRSKSKRNINVKSFVLWSLLLAGIAGLLWLSIQRKKDANLAKVYVSIHKVESEDYVVSQDDVVAIVEAYLGFDLGATVVGDLQLRGIEQRLLQDPRVERAELYLDSNDRLHIYVQQRDPLLRVKGASVDYYIGGDGKAIVSSAARPARVPIVTGYNRELPLNFPNNEEPTILNDVYVMASAAADDVFLSALVEQYHIDEHDEVWLIPKVGQEKLLVGNAEELDDRLTRLKAVYQEGMRAIGNDQYAELHFKWKGQVTRVAK